MRISSLRNEGQTSDAEIISASVPLLDPASLEAPRRDEFLGLSCGRNSLIPVVNDWSQLLPLLQRPSPKETSQRWVAAPYFSRCRAVKSSAWSAIISSCGWPDCLADLRGRAADLLRRDGEASLTARRRHLPSRRLLGLIGAEAMSSATRSQPHSRAMVTVCSAGVSFSS